MQSLNVLDGLIEFRSFHRPSSQVRKIGRTERIAGCNLSLLWVRFKLFEMKEFRRFELHKFTSGILKIQASPPRFKRCLRGDTVHRFLACWNTYSGHLWPTYFALATEFFLHSFPVSIADDELPARNYRRTLKAPIQDQLQSCTRFFTGICQHSRHNLS